MQYQFHVFSLLCLFTIVHWSQFLINIHLLLAGKGLVSPFYRRTNWPKDVIRLFGSCLCFCDGIVSLSCWNILQTILALSPESPLSLPVPWWSFGSNTPCSSCGGFHWLLQGREEVKHEQSLIIYIKLSLATAWPQAAAGKTFSFSVIQGHFVLDLFCNQILWNSSNTLSLEHTHPTGPLDIPASPK